MKKILELHKVNPIALLIFFILLFGLFAIFGNIENKKEIKRLLEKKLEEEKSYLLNNLEDRLKFITNDLLDKYRKFPPRNQNEHLAATKHLIQSSPFLLTINYINPDRRILFVSPYEPNKAVIGLKIELPAPKEALELSSSSNRPYLSKPFEIIQGSPGFSLMIPYDNKGFFEIVFTTESVFSTNSPFRRSKDIALQVFDGTHLAFQSDEHKQLQAKHTEFTIFNKGTLLNRDLRFSALPKHELIKSASKFWQILSGAGFISSFFLLSLIIILQRNNIKYHIRMEGKQHKLITELKQALSEIKTLRGILPICSFCKQIRDDKGYWNMVEEYISKHSDVKFTHSICPDCREKHYPEIL